MTTDRTDTDAVIELATSAAIGVQDHAQLDTEEASLRAFVLPPGHRVALVDTEAIATYPRRPRGTVLVHDSASFIAAVRQRALTDAGDNADGLDVHLYADDGDLALVAILNDDVTRTNRTELVADWRDYRVSLDVRTRPEWDHWRGHDGDLLDQAAFAEHIEDGLAELVDPTGADALELAQTFHADGTLRFKGGERLASGLRQFTYEETATATGGAGGTIAVPERLKLTIAPFYGSPRYEVEALFRWRLPRGGGALQLGYKLVRPDDVERAAFADVVTAVGDELGLTVIRGAAPGPTPAAPFVANVVAG